MIVVSLFLKWNLWVAQVWPDLALHLYVLISRAYDNWIALPFINSSLAVFFGSWRLLLRLRQRLRLICFFHHPCLICWWHVWEIVWWLNELGSSSLIISKFALLVIMTWVHATIISVTSYLRSNCIQCCLRISCLLIYFWLLIIYFLFFF